MGALHKLTATKVRNAKPGKYSDGAGLWLHKRKDGGAQWVLRVTVHGRRRERARAQHGLCGPLWASPACCAGLAGMGLHQRAGLSPRLVDAERLGLPATAFGEISDSAGKRTSQHCTEAVLGVKVLVHLV